MRVAIRTVRERCPLEGDWPGPVVLEIATESKNHLVLLRRLQRLVRLLRKRSVLGVNRGWRSRYSETCVRTGLTCCPASTHRAYPTCLHLTGRERRIRSDCVDLNGGVFSGIRILINPHTPIFASGHLSPTTHNFILLPRNPVDRGSRRLYRLFLFTSSSCGDNFGNMGTLCLQTSRVLAKERERPFKLSLSSAMFFENLLEPDPPRAGRVGHSANGRLNLQEAAGCNARKPLPRRVMTHPTAKMRSIQKGLLRVALDKVRGP